MSPFWRILKQQWTIEEFSIFSNSSHLEWRTGLSDTILKGTHTGTTPARFGLIWSSGLRGEDLNVIPVFLWDPCCLSCCFVLSLMYPMLTVSLDCPILFAPSDFSNVYIWQNSFVFHHLLFTNKVKSCRKSSFTYTEYAILWCLLYAYSYPTLRKSCTFDFPHTTRELSSSYIVSKKSSNSTSTRYWPL